MLRYSDDDLLEIAINEPYGQLHKLAENRDAELYRILADKLYSKYDLVREMSIELIGFHYNLERDILGVIKTIAKTDESPDVRSMAIAVYLIHSEGIEDFIIECFNKESDMPNKLSIFQAILYKIGIAPSLASDMREIFGERLGYNAKNEGKATKDS